MGEGTSPARPEVVAAREALLAARGQVDEELVRLEASARAAVDIPAKIRRSPAKAAGLAAGAGFLLVGGPKRLFRRARQAVRGPSEPMPKSMLPKEIDATLRKLGDDGDRVRGTIEREFAHYLDAGAEERKSRDLAGTFSALLRSSAKPLAAATARSSPSGSSPRTPRSTATSWTGSAPAGPRATSRAEASGDGSRQPPHSCHRARRRW